VVRGDAYASILRVKYMLEGQYVEICPRMVRHWDALVNMYRQAEASQEISRRDV